MIIADIENAYLNTKTTKKLHTRLEKGFGELSFKTVKIIIALCSLNSSDRYFKYI